MRTSSKADKPQNGVNSDFLSFKFSWSICHKLSLKACMRSQAKYHTDSAQDPADKKSMG